MTTVVYKLGGSLLDLDDLPERLRRILSPRIGTQPLMVVGGGLAADLVRLWDRIHDLAPDQAHRLAIEAMALGESLLTELLPESALVVDRHGADEAWAAGRIPVLATARFLHDEEPRSRDGLPVGWGVTSDAIAAWVAGCWPADELVLLKSVPLPVDATPETAARDGLVDPVFPGFVSRLGRVGWVNLRDDSAGILRWDVRSA